MNMFEDANDNFRLNNCDYLKCVTGLVTEPHTNTSNWKSGHFSV